MKTLPFALLSFLTAAISAKAAVVDVLDDLSNFGTPQFSSLNVLPGGEVSFVSNAPNEDRVVKWMRDGDTPLDLATESQLTVVPTSQLNSGEWGLWALYFNGISYLTEENLLPFTSSTAPTSLNVSDFAPATADNYVLHLRVKEAAGDGFVFTEIRAVPEPGSTLLASLALFPLLRRNRRAA